MSSGAEGVVLLLPIAAIAFPALAVAGAAVVVAGAGVVAVNATGQALLAGGREMRAMADENLRMQRAAKEAAMSYERDLKRNMVANADALLKEMADAHEAHQLALQATRVRLAAARAKVQASPPATINWAELAKMREQVVNAPPVTVTREERLTVWWKKVDRAQAWAASLTTAAQPYIDGPYQGLFDMNAVTKALEGAQEQLAQLQREASYVSAGKASPNIEAYEVVVAELSWVSQRLSKMRLQVDERQAARATALQALEAAHAQLAEFSRSVEAGTKTTALRIVQQSLDGAVEAMAAGKFNQTRSTAEAVLDHLKRLGEAPANERQANILLLLDEMHKHVEPLQNLPELQAFVAQWINEHDRVRLLVQTDMEAAWAAVNEDQTGLAARAEDIQRAGLQVLLREAAKGMAQLTQETLHDMGYTVEQSQGKGNTQTIVGRQGTRRFIVSMTELGEVDAKIEGFGDATCKHVLDDFVNRLKAKGVGATWQETFSLTSAVERLVRILQESGHNVKLEPTSNGVTVLAAGGGKARVDYDGRVQVLENWKQQVRTHVLDKNRELENVYKTTLEEIKTWEPDPEWEEDGTLYERLKVRRNR